MFPICDLCGGEVSREEASEGDYDAGKVNHVSTIICNRSLGNRLTYLDQERNKIVRKLKTLSR